MQNLTGAFQRNLENPLPGFFKIESVKDEDMNQMDIETSPDSLERAVNIALIIFCMGFQTVGTAGISLFMPIIRGDLGFSFTQGGSLSAASYVGYALMQIPAGYLADRYGVKRIFFTGVLGSTVLCFGFGLASHYWHAIFIQTAAGFFNAFIFASGLSLLVIWFGPERRATAMGFSIIGIFLGNLIMNTAGPFLAEWFSWRLPFMGFASLGVLAALFYLFYGKVPPRTKMGQTVRPIDVLRLFSHRYMWLCGGIQYIRLAVFQGITFWLPSLLIDEKGLSLQAAGLVIAFRGLMFPPTNILGGYLSDRLKKPTALIGFSLLVLAITTILIVRTDHMFLLVLFIVLNALFLQVYFGPLFALPIERYGAHMMGSLSGFGNLFANLGGITFSFLVGLIKDKTGLFESGFYAISLACILGIVFTLFLEKMRRDPSAS
jgi:predicted MFS family arabinose efflux permease